MSADNNLPGLAPSSAFRSRIERVLGAGVTYVHRTESANNQQKMRIGVHSDSYNREIVVNGLRHPGMYWSTLVDEIEAL